MQIFDYLDEGATFDPDALCFVRDGAECWTYRDAIDFTHRVAAAFARDGFGPGDKVTVLSPNRADAFLAQLGAIRAGLMWLPVNPRYSIESICKLMAHFAPDVVIVSADFGERLDDLRAAAPSIRKILSLDDALGDAPAIADWMAAPGTRHAPPDASPDAVAAVLPTGGTTGVSKGVLQTHRAFEFYTALHMLVMPHDRPPRFLAATPLTHAAGAICFPMLARGGTIYVQDSAKPKDVARALVEHDISDIFLPPTAVYNMLADEEVRRMRFPALKYLYYSAAPMSVSKLREALEWLGPVMTQTYGQTEALMICTAMRPEDHYAGGDVTGAIADDERLSSCGRAAPLVKVGIMDEDGNLLPDGENGEIVVRASHVMQGYRDDPEASAAASRHGWHHTGDIGYRDAAGYYHVVDRLRDVIISGGLNILPSEIEQVLWAHPAVKDCAVVGAPDDKWGELVTAVVEPKAGAQVSAEELIAYCRDHLGSVKAPKAIQIWDDLPRSPVGKVLKREIRDRFWAGMKRRI